MYNTSEKLIDIFMHLDEHISYKEEYGVLFDTPFAEAVEDVLQILKNGVTALPCKVGDTVYTNLAMRGWYYRDKDRPYSAQVVFMGLNNSEEMGGGLINVVYGKNDNMMQFRFSDIGKTVFLSCEEAEKALAERSKK